MVRRSRSREDAAKSVCFARRRARGSGAARAGRRAVVADGALLRILETFSETISVAAYEPLRCPGARPGTRGPWIAARVCRGQLRRRDRREVVKIGAHSSLKRARVDFALAARPDSENGMRERDGDRRRLTVRLDARRARERGRSRSPSSQGATPSATWLLAPSTCRRRGGGSSPCPPAATAGRSTSTTLATVDSSPAGTGWALRRALRAWTPQARRHGRGAARRSASFASIDGTESRRDAGACTRTCSAAAARDAPPRRVDATLLGRRRKRLRPDRDPRPPPPQPRMRCLRKSSSRQKTKTKTKPKPTFEKPILEPVVRLAGVVSGAMCRGAASRRASRTARRLRASTRRPALRAQPRRRARSWRCRRWRRCGATRVAMCGTGEPAVDSARASRRARWAGAGPVAGSRRGSAAARIAHAAGATRRRRRASSVSRAKRSRAIDYSLPDEAAEVAAAEAEMAERKGGRGGAPPDRPFYEMLGVAPEATEGEIKKGA